MRKQTKLVAVLSAAALLAMGASMTSFAAGWQKDDAGVCHHAPKRCDRVNIAVTDGQQRGHTPPDAAECIAENVRLSVVLDTIHAHAARQHQHHDDEHRGNDLVPFFIEYGGNDVERVVFRIEPEQMENPRHAQHTENDEALGV